MLVAAFVILSQFQQSTSDPSSSVEPQIECQNDNVAASTAETPRDIGKCNKEEEEMTTNADQSMEVDDPVPSGSGSSSNTSSQQQQQQSPTPGFSGAYGGARPRVRLSQPQSAGAEHSPSYRTYTYRLGREFDPDNLTEQRARLAEGHFLRMSCAFSALWDRQACSHGALSHIDVIKNETLELEFNSKKLALRDAKRPDQELLLFHGTPLQNVDSILKNNFDLDKAVRSAYGKGIYFSEYPSVALSYGEGLILSRVLPGRVQFFGSTFDTPSGSDYDSFSLEQDWLFPNQQQQPRRDKVAGTGQIRVIRHPSQILPFCVLYMKIENPPKPSSLLGGSSLSRTLARLSTLQQSLTSSGLSSSSVQATMSMVQQSLAASAAAAVPSTSATSSTDRCQICKRDADSNLYGVYGCTGNCCQGCVDFFASQYDMHRNAPCAKGTFSCDVNNDDLLFCDGCRLGLCLDLGMNFVQLCVAKGYSSLGADTMRVNFLEARLRVRDAYSRSIPSMSQLAIPPRLPGSFNDNTACPICGSKTSPLRDYHGKALCNDCNDRFAMMLATGAGTAFCTRGTFRCFPEEKCSGCLLIKSLDLGLPTGLPFAEREALMAERKRMELKFTAVEGVIKELLSMANEDLLLEGETLRRVSAYRSFTEDPKHSSDQARIMEMKMEELLVTAKGVIAPDDSQVIEVLSSDSGSELSSSDGEEE